MTKIPLKLYDDQNTFEKFKITKIEVWGILDVLYIFDKLKVIRIF